MGYKIFIYKNPAAGRKGQSEIMEYVLMVVFIVAAIIAIILFLTWWGVQQSKIESYMNQEERVVAIAKQLMGDYMFANGDSIFDDAKLTAINASLTCEELQKILGKNWYVKIKALDMEGEKACRWNDYPDCNVWSMCGQRQNAINLFAKNFPVNIYRKVSGKTALGVLHVEVYS